MSLRSRITDLVYGSRSLTWDEYLSWFQFNGLQYGLTGSSTTMGKKQESIGEAFVSLSQLAHKQNGVVFGCITARSLLFSEARFQFRQLRSGRPGDLFGTQALAPLEKPWPGGTTGDLLTKAEHDVSLAGNSFWVRRPGPTLKRLRPDWVTLLMGSFQDPDVDGFDVDAEVIGYIYQPGGSGGGRDLEVYDRNEVAHYAPHPDPIASFRGMSWLTPVLRDVMGDKAATDHKLEFFEHAATTNLMVKVDPNVRDPNKFTEWVKAFRREHEGPGNRYKTLFLGGGSDATVIGANLQQADFKAVQGAGETRIATAARVPPVILGISEGLQGSSLNQGNYAMARRQMVDMLMRELWRNFAGSMSFIIPAPPGSELWYDDRDIPALRENEEDLARIQGRHVASIKTAIDAGFDPASAVDAVTSGDLKRLKHSGLVSVQLLPPGAKDEPPSSNGKPAAPAPADEGENARADDWFKDKDAWCPRCECWSKPRGRRGRMVTLACSHLVPAAEVVTLT